MTSNYFAYFDVRFTSGIYEFVLFFNFYFTVDCQEVTFLLDHILQHIRRTGSVAPLMRSIELNEKRLSNERLKELQEFAHYQPAGDIINEAFDPDQAYSVIDEEATDYRIMWEQLMLGQNILGTGVFGDVIEGVVFKSDKQSIKVAVRKWKSKFKTDGML